VGEGPLLGGPAAGPRSDAGAAEPHASEGNPLPGRGSRIAEAGDVAIMDGSGLACGAVAAVKTVKNPISLARLVMQRSPHVLLVGEGAE
jgi:beta-aspartyl-peptidase (threonine type)